MRIQIKGARFGTRDTLSLREFALLPEKVVIIQTPLFEGHCRSFQLPSVGYCSVASVFCQGGSQIETEGFPL